MTDDPDESVSKTEQDVRKLRPPNKKKYDEELEIITNQIRAIENELKQIGVKGNENYQLDMQSIRAEITATIERRRKIDNELGALNQSIRKQMDKLTKIQSALHYKSEDRINEAIRKLEFQMKTRNFKLSEEKKIVAEIDSLNRSKKSLVQYTTLKKEIDGMRDSQRRMRGERDHYYKAVTQLKSREEELRKKSQEGYARSAEFKKELDSLYEKKRALTSQFRQSEKEYNAGRVEAKKKLREETFKRREENKKALQEQRRKELDEYEATREPYEDEKLLCNTLITYLQRYLVANDHDKNQEAANHAQVHNEKEKEIEEKEGMFVLRKKRSEEDLFGGMQRNKGKRSKRDKRKSTLMQNKPITHSAEIFEKFEFLKLSAPSLQFDVPKAIEELNARKEYYNSLLHPIMASMEAALDNEYHTGSSSASMSESAICESIPSTPEVHHDNQPPAFPTDASEEGASALPLQPRRFSADSGTCSDRDDLAESQSSVVTVHALNDSSNQILIDSNQHTQTVTDALTNPNVSEELISAKDASAAEVCDFDHMSQVCLDSNRHVQDMADLITSTNRSNKISGIEGRERSSQGHDVKPQVPEPYLDNFLHQNTNESIGDRNQNVSLQTMGRGGTLLYARVVRGRDMNDQTEATGSQCVNDCS